MSWITKTGRFLSFRWKAGTTGVQGLNESATESTLERAIDSLKGSFPELNDAKIATVEYDQCLSPFQSLLSSKRYLQVKTSLYPQSGW